MTKTILITGATDGIGRATAHALTEKGHNVLIHGRSPEKVAAGLQRLGLPEKNGYLADMTDFAAVRAMAGRVRADHQHLDVLINNAGVLKTAPPRNADGVDIRFVVNTFAPVILAKALAPVMDAQSRVVNLSSAAQAPVDIAAMKGEAALGDMEAYAQSKLALTIWGQETGRAGGDNAPEIYSINPGSLLATNMVREGFGTAGNDIEIGVDILVRAATGAEFAGRSGDYFDNDAGRFADPHAAAADPAHNKAVLAVIDAVTAG